ncbi:MAG TPA: hypothetical protein P5214_10550 [Rectinema sp.]|mgnify:CR=1 FL=1|nr:hypothetical protein [Rectinema sp.]
MVTVIDVFDMNEEESERIRQRLSELADKHWGDKDRVKGLVLDIMKEPDIRSREIMLFLIGLSMESCID